MQLVAYGAQDIYLSGNPQVTFFKVVYRRHTNFAMESIEQTFSGAADFGKKVTCAISRNGDLIHRVYLRVELPTVTIKAESAFRWLNWVGHILIKKVDIDIGGQTIDRHYGEWLHIWNELTQTSGHMIGYANMVGNIPQLVNPVENTSTTETKDIKGEILYIPLEFWFCRNVGQALPMIALQYHDVKLTLELADVRECYWAAKKDGGGNWVYDASAAMVPGLQSASLFVDYVYLDTEERRRFAQVSHEYLIEQLQFTGDESASAKNVKIKLNFNHPTKAIYWVCQKEDHLTHTGPSFGKQHFNFTDGLDTTYSTDFAFDQSNLEQDASAGLPGVAAGGANNVYLPTSFEGGVNPVAKAKLQLNGHDRFSERDGRYFNLVQPYQHHENVPKMGINMYSFALKPEEHQPSGSCNMSRIDNAILGITLTPESVASGATVRIKVFAWSVNVLRIMSGMGGLKSIIRISILV